MAGELVVCRDRSGGRLGRRREDQQMGMEVSERAGLGFQPGQPLAAVRVVIVGGLAVPNGGRVVDAGHLVRLGSLLVGVVVCNLLVSDTVGVFDGLRVQECCRETECKYGGEEPSRQSPPVGLSVQ
jgi:hypothetical protein